MNLANIGLTGINAAMHRLQTAGHNISNADTDGYNRQSVSVSTAGSQNMGSGFIGRGASVDTINRSYDSFLFNQLVRSQSGGAALVSYGNEISQVNNLFADRTVGISPALTKFFDGVDAVASSPADPAARSEMLGRASSLVAQINEANAFLDAQRSDINTQVTTVVKQINSYVERIADLNARIMEARAGNPNHAPNDLLDQRDLAYSELSQLADVKVIEQGNVYNLTIGNGQMLLGGSTTFPLQAVPSAADPTRTVIAYTATQPGGGVQAIEMPETSIKGGSLGGLLQYRYEVLDTAQNELGRMATGLALAFNSVHEAGVDQAGNPAEAFFSLADPKVIPSQNTQTALSVTFDENALGNLTAHDYSVSFQNNEYVITDVTTKREIYRSATAPSGSIDGLNFNITGTPQSGDQWLVQPTRNAASSGSLKVALTDAAHIAAGAAGGPGDTDGSNALELAALRSKKILGNGSMDLTETYSRIVNNVAVQAQSNGTAAKAQSSLIQQNAAAQQSVSGVNMNEEYMNVMRYQEQFRAASRLIDVSSTLFDTLLSLKT